MGNVFRVDAHCYCVVNVFDITTAQQIAEINRPSAVRKKIGEMSIEIYRKHIELAIVREKNKWRRTSI